MDKPSQTTIDRVIREEGTKGEVHEVFAWFKTKEGETYLSDLIDLDFEHLQEEPYRMNGRDVPSQLIMERIQAKIKRKRLKRVLLRIAAIVIPIVLIVTFYMIINSRVEIFASTEYEEVYVPKGETLQMAFQDGSKVSLNSDSRIRYPRNFGLGARRIELMQGEGYFTVTKAKGRPFIVSLRQLDVRVLGTKFNVKDYPQEKEISIALEKGSIELSGDMFYPFTMKPEEIVVYDRETGKYSIKHSEKIEVTSSWRKQIISFEDAPLSEVINELNRKYNVNFTVKDKDAYQFHYTIETKSKDLSGILKELELITPVRFTQKNDSILVSMKEGWTEVN